MHRLALSLVGAAILTSCTLYEVHFQGAARSVHPWQLCGGQAEPHCLRAFAELQRTHEAPSAEPELAAALKVAVTSQEKADVTYDLALLQYAAGKIPAARASLEAAISLHPRVAFRAFMSALPPKPPPPPTPRPAPSPKPEPTPKFPPSVAASAVDDRASQGLAKLSRLMVVGTRVDQTFHDDGHLEISILPVDAKDAPILDNRIYVEVETSCEVKFPIGSTVSVNTVRKTAASKPYHVGINMDGSGSMSDNDPKKVRGDAARAFIDVIAEDFPKSQFALWEFASDVHLVQELTADVDAARAGVKVTATGNTALHKATYDVLDYLEKHADPKFQDAVLVLTDGLDNASGKIHAGDVVARAQAKNVRLFAVALGNPNDSGSRSFVADLQQYAHDTDGFFVYAKDPEALSLIFDGIAQSQLRGYVTVRLALSGPQKFPAFARCSLDLTAHAGGESYTETLQFVVPKDK